MHEYQRIELNFNARRFKAVDFYVFIDSFQRLFVRFFFLFVYLLFFLLENHVKQEDQSKSYWIFKNISISIRACECNVLRVF